MMSRSEKKATAMQFGRTARAYAHSAGHAAGADLETVVRFLNPDADMRVLDVATGPGHTAMAIAPFVRTVIAADFTVPMLVQTNVLAAERGHTNLFTAATDAERLAFRAHAFDAVTCRIAAHHFHDPMKFLAELRGVLKPGGCGTLSWRCSS